MNPEVLIVGAGPAGIAAALRLARAGVRVLVLEGASYAGAENWSGSVYHAEPLLRPDVLGADLWREAPTERRIVARSLWVHDGVTAAGFEARANAGNDYGEAWTVLRPKVDRWLAARAIDFGVTLLPATTVTGLRYDGDRVVGVNTSRGPIEAPVVFLTEGDASGLLAREGLETDGRRPRFAQGIKAVFRLPAAEIERRFGLAPGEGVAQEWLVRNGQLAGRPVPLDITAFLYTNRDSLSVGVVLPLDRLAAHGVADHPHLFKRVLALPGMRELLAGAEQVAYGAKVIRAGGVLETPVWVRDGLAVGGGSLGLGMEFPYPNFIGPAIVSATCFADAVVELRARGDGYGAEALERTYSARLRETPEYANARLFRYWPGAIHGPLLFEQLPELVGQFVNADMYAPRDARAQRRRALAMQLRHLRADLRQAPGFLRGLRMAKPARNPPPLDVRFVALSETGTREIFAGVDPLLGLSAEVLGHFYGRGEPDMRARLALVRRAVMRRGLGAAASAARLAATTTAGAVALARDLITYKVRKLPLRIFLTRPYHAHAAASTRALDWLSAQREAASPTTWLAAMDRHRPDSRHITLPVVAASTAQQLRNVCPAEVYSVLSRVGGAASQYENCIKCESCRVTVPGIDWNRTSGHRLCYRVPADGRYGFDAAATTALVPAPVRAPVYSPGDRAIARRLLESLRARPAIVGGDALVAWRKLIGSLSDRALRERLGTWLDRHAYGWLESELAAQTDKQIQATAVRSRSDHAAHRREHAWRALLQTVFTPARLRALADRPWERAEERALLDWIDSVRDDRDAALAWLAERAPALAWVAANHFLAESAAGHPLVDQLSAPLARLPDGRSQWVPTVSRYISAGGAAITPGQPIAHGAGLDAAQPVRFALPDHEQPLRVTSDLARAVLALGLGMARALRTRAVAYAAGRVQFRGELKDSEGRDTIAKFGAVKSMLAGIEQAVHVLSAARDYTEREPLRVIELVHGRMGLRMDAVPWMAGQIFGGMAYSEEDILAPRYRDAFVLSQWPGGAEQDVDAGRAFARTLPFTGEPVLARDLTVLTAAQAARLEVAPQPAAPSASSGFANTRRGGALFWKSDEKFAYRAGAFVNGSLLASAQLLTPEHFRRDPRLRATRTEVLRLMRRGFRSPLRGEPYGRYIDRIHGVPPADVERLRDFNAFATIVPARLGGKGWSKADYAVLNMITMGHGDTSLGLLIMASTSIGTMPVLLGLEQDLPRLERELAACLADIAAWDALAHDLDALIAQLEHPEPKAMKALFTRLGGRARRVFMAPGSSLKYLARDFLLSLQKTVEVAKTRDLDALAPSLAALRAQVPGLRAALDAEHAAIPARRAAHERFLRFLGTGQISAFALTEPAAGSDTGGVQTRAVLREVVAVPDAHGCYRFTPHGGGEPRVLLDAQRLEFDRREVRYRLPSGELAVLDDTAWDLVRNTGERRLRSAGSSFVYHDIGSVQRRGDDWLYAYWEISGNKMWITNGAVADRYCLYAQTEQGETGFMVERRSEGLRIGPNEHKLGQRASPTNELTLDRVRVSADQVIGFRGHGQVNALETLSVGRGGLVMGCATMLERLLWLHANVWARHEDYRAVAQFELDRLQTLAARLVGLMDRADLGAGDFRIEAALSKYLASEGLHRVLGWFEHLRGPQAAATEELIEKWRRDARILNIYEGTNEVQRFLVLKDLPSLLSGFAHSATLSTGSAELDAALRAFRDFATPRLATLKANVWLDPDQQVSWFPVVDWAGELYVWCALHERARLLEENADPADRPTIRRLHAAMERQREYLSRLAAQIAADFAKSGGEDDVTAATLGVARAALQPAAEPAGPACVGALDGAWHVVLRSRYEWNAGRRTWAGWHAADLAALDRLLAWREGSPALAVKIAALVPPGLDDHLRRLQAAGAEVFPVHQDPGHDDAVALAHLLVQLWPRATRFALGYRAGDARDELFANTLAGALGTTLVTDISAVGAHRRGEWIEDQDFARHYLARDRKCLFLWDLKPDGRSDTFSIDDWLGALRAPALPVAGELPAPRAVVPTSATPTDDIPPAFTDAKALATWLRRRLQGAGDEPQAPLKPGNPAAARVLWVTATATLARVGHAAGLALAQDLAGSFVVLALGDDAPPMASRLLSSSGCMGVWHLPGAPESAQTVTRIDHLPAVDFIVVDPELAALAGALAAARSWPLYAPVDQVGPGDVAVTGEDVRCVYPRAARGVFIAGQSYRAPRFDQPSASLPLAMLPTPAAPSALARWCERTRARPVGLAGAPIVVDVGLGATGELFEKYVLPLHTALSQASGRPVGIGATRKVTQDVKLLPATQQIGQTGIGIAPELVLALGVSGAPQHMSGIANTALVIAINRDAGAPIFHWHEHGGPRVVRCIGDLDDWLPELLAHLAGSGGAETGQAKTAPDKAALSEKAV